jgi:peptidoglycan/xylan/chitin deacetylase (PgdA/CDA1 family)
MTVRHGLIVAIIILLNCTVLAMAAPTYSNNSTNSTLAGEPALFSLKISDTNGLGGYIFSTNNTGTWVNDTMVSFGSTIPWNSWTNEGSLLEGFNNSAEWAKEGSITVFDDTSRYVEGSSSMGIFTGAESTLAVKKIINLNLSSAKNFYFWFYTNRPLNPDSSPYSNDSDSTDPSIILYFTSDPGYSKSFTCSVFGSELKAGWNKIVIDKNNCYQDTNVSESWSNIMVSMQFRIYIPDTMNTTVNLDNLRYDYDGGAVNKTVVIITFDDGWKTQLTAYNIMKANNQRGVAFVYPQAQIEEWPDFMSTAELKTLYNDGWDISSHSMTHYDLENGNLTYSDLVNEITGSKNWLDSQNFTRSSGFFAYPYHMYNDTVLSLVNSTYKLARNDFGAEAQPHIYLDDPDNIPFLIKATEVLSSTTPDYIMSVIDRAVLQKSFLVLSFHQINDIPTDETMWPTANFQTVSNYIKDRADLGLLDVMTFSDYYSTISNMPKTAWSNVTKNLTNAVNATVNWCVYAKDTSNSWSSSCKPPFSLVTNATKPLWTNSQYVNVSNYTQTGASEFNITWNSTVGLDKVLITVRNSTHVLVNNASMNMTSGDSHLATYGYSVALPAGKFNWTSYANDTLGRSNTTSNFTFTINKAANPLDLYLSNDTEYVNQDVEAVYGMQTNATGICPVGKCSLYRNGNLSTDNNTQVTLAAGVWEYVLFAEQTQNYSANSTSYNLTVLKAPNPIHLYLNGTEYDEQNITIVYSTKTNVTGTCDIGNCSLWRNSDPSEDNSTEMILGAGSWEYMLFTAETQNYSGNSTSYNITINKGILEMSIEFSPSNTVERGSQSTATGIENNEGDSDVNYTLYRDDALVSDIYPYQETVALDVGTHMYIFNATEGENWTAGNVSAPLAVQVANIVYIPSGGGGGGGGPIISVSPKGDDNVSSESTFLSEDVSETVQTKEICVEDWMCLEWSECSDGIQTRTCIDINNCGTDSSKPEESLECGEQSFATGMFNFLTTPIGFGLIALIAMLVIFIFLPIREKLKI